MDWMDAFSAERVMVIRPGKGNGLMKVQIVEPNAARYCRLSLCLFTVWVVVFGIFANFATAEETGAFALQPVCLKYRISCDFHRVIKDYVKHNQSLSEILTTYDVPSSKIHTIAQKSKEVFDVRGIKAGNPYSIVIKNTVLYFIYEKDPINYVVYDLSDPVDVYLGRKKVETRLRVASGVIESSLSQSMTQIGLDYDLIQGLADIFAWTVDFHHLKRGDHFVVIYEENYVENKPSGLKKIVAAKFNHSEKDFYAFYSNQEGREAYYDENGKSLQKAFLKAPLRYTRITSRPSKNRLHPILKIRRPHLGIDYAAPHGTPIQTIGDGVIRETGHHRALGKYVTIEHNGVYKSQYLHMARIAKEIRPGVRVNRGDVIGYVGSTGLASGPHLEFRFWKNGKIFNHLDASESAGEPLQEDALRLFQPRITALKDRLDTFPPNQKLLITESRLSGI